MQSISQNYFFFPICSFSFFICLNVALTSSREETIPMRIRVTYIVSQSITTTFLPSPSFVLRERNKFTGLFALSRRRFFAHQLFYLLFLPNFHIHTERLLINHLFRLVYYVTSINYPFWFRFGILRLIDPRKLLNFCVYTSFINRLATLNNLSYSGAKR